MHPRSRSPLWSLSHGAPGRKPGRVRRKEGTMAMLVRHAMTEVPITVEARLNASDAAARMRAEDVGVLPVMDDGRLIGLVTDRDLVIRVVAEGRDPTKVHLSELASESPVTIGPDEPPSARREALTYNKGRPLPV